jgi:hypothetical protein
VFVIRHEFQREKFIELLLYIAERSETDPKFGETKLNKLLFYADFIGYRDLGAPITGARYQALQFGPAPVAMVPVLRELQETDQLHIRSGVRGAYEQKKPIALRAPELTAFTGAEIALVDELISAFWDLDASQISDRSHEEIGWRLATLQEDIPYETAFVRSIEQVDPAAA